MPLLNHTTSIRAWARFAALILLALGGCDSKAPATQDDFEQAYFAAMRAHAQAAREKPRHPRKVEARKVAHLAALERSIANADRTMGAELDRAAALYRDSRRDLYMLAVGTRNLLAARKLDTPTSLILDGAAKVAGTNTPPGGAKAVLSPFLSLYRPLRFAGLSHDEAIRQLSSPPVSQTPSLPVSPGTR